MKRIVLISSMFISMALQGVCFQPLDGMNLWRMTASIGSCIDTLGESTIDLLDELICAVGFVVQLTQADFAAPVIISQPGYYKICENITASTALVIESDNVTLDLGSRFLDGVLLTIADDQKHITIKNGLIRNVARFITIGTGSQDVTIQDLVLDSAIADTTMYGILTEGASTGLTIRNIRFYDAAPINILLVEAENCVVENIRCVSTNQALAPTLGTDATIRLISGSVVKLRDIIVTNPYEGLDCILLNGCDGVDLIDIDISSDFPDTGGAAIGVRAVDSQNLTHDNVSVFGEVFETGFSAISSEPPGVFYNNFSYTGCSATNIGNRGFNMANGVGVLYQECTATGCGGNGIEIYLSFDLICDSCATNFNNGAGLRVLQNVVSALITDIQAGHNHGGGVRIEGGDGVLIQGGLLSNNGARGLLMEGFSSAVVVNDVFAESNFAEGFKFVLCDNIVMSGCQAISNVADGFHFEGVNNGQIPGGAPQGTVGKSPVTLEGCTAISNGLTGFYFTDTGGVLVRDCSATYNGVHGFHFDSGTWNTSAEGCTALDNGEVGFITWDPLLLYQTRFRDCFAGTNGNTYTVFNPAGGFDFAMGNIPGVQTATPIAAIYPSSTLGLPEVALFGAVSPMFCVYG